MPEADFMRRYFTLILLSLVAPIAEAQVDHGNLLPPQLVDSVHLSPAAGQRTGPLARELNAQEVELTKRKTIETSLTLLSNSNQVIPVSHLERTRIASVAVGSERITPFQKMLANYARVDHFQLKQDFTHAERVEIQEKLKGYDLVIAGIHSRLESKSVPLRQEGTSSTVSSEGLDGASDEMDSLLTFLSAKQKSIASFFCSPACLSAIRVPLKMDGLLLAYQNDSLVQELSAQLIFGGIGAKGKLTVPVAGKFILGEGISIPKPIRLKYTIPEEVGISSGRINFQIDSIVSAAMGQKAFPGCNVLVAKDGRVILHKAYGFHGYDRIIPESENDLYDLASLTKITAGLPIWMKLYDEDLVHPDEKVSTYYPEWKNRLFHRSNKSDITVRELLAHQSGLTPFIPFWKKTLKMKLEAK